MYKIDEIKKVIPQREPFLFVEEITAVYPDGADGVYTFKESDEFFKGHFPNGAVVPGVLMVEALAQTGAFFLLSDPENADKNALLLGVDKARFRAMVRPGERCEMIVRQRSRRFNVATCVAELKVGGKLAVSCELACMLVDKAAVAESK